MPIKHDPKNGQFSGGGGSSGGFKNEIVPQADFDKRVADKVAGGMHPEKAHMAVSGEVDTEHYAKQQANKKPVAKDESSFFGIKKTASGYPEGSMAAIKEAKDGGPGSGPHKVGTPVKTESGETGTISHVRESADPAYPHKYRVTSSQKTPGGYSQHIEQGHYINHGRLTPVDKTAKDEMPTYGGRVIGGDAQSMPAGMGNDGQWKF